MDDIIHVDYDFRYKPLSPPKMGGGTKSSTCGLGGLSCGADVLGSQFLISPAFYFNIFFGPLLTAQLLLYKPTKPSEMKKNITIVSNTTTHF